MIQITARGEGHQQLALSRGVGSTSTGLAPRYAMCAFVNRLCVCAGMLERVLCAYVCVCAHLIANP